MPIPAGGSGVVDYSTPAGQVRLLVPDTDADNQIFDDSAITAFLTLENNNVRMAAALALDTIASSEVMVSKVIKTQDLQVDGAKVAAELRARAQALRDQAAQYLPDGTPFALDIVDFNPAAAVEALYGIDPFAVPVAWIDPPEGL